MTARPTLTEVPELRYCLDCADAREDMIGDEYLPYIRCVNINSDHHGHLLDPYHYSCSHMRRKEDSLCP